MTNTWKEGKAKDLLKYQNYIWVYYKDPRTGEEFSSTLVEAPTRSTCSPGCHPQITIRLHGVPEDDYLILDENEKIRYSDDWEF